MEMSVFVREHLNYWYSLKAFYFAKTLADLPFQVNKTLHFKHLFITLCIKNFASSILSWRETLIRDQNVVWNDSSQQIWRATYFPTFLLSHFLLIIFSNWGCHFSPYNGSIIMLCPVCNIPELKYLSFPQIVFTGLYVLIVYYMSGQPMDPARVGMFVSINILTALVSQSIGLLIGAAMKIETAVYLGPVTTIPVVLFSGFFVTFDTIPGYLQWLTYISYVRYGFEGAMLSVYGFTREKLNCSEAFCRFRIPSKFLEELSMDAGDYWLDAVALVVIFILIRIIAYFVLVWKIRIIR